ncbi:2-hydroxyacid dehydrogenase [Thermoproteota archaeon]
MKVLVVYKKLAKRLKKRLPDDIEIIYPEEGTDEEISELARDVEVIISSKLSSVVAENALQLKLLQKTGAGVDDMPFEALKETTYMANTSGSNPLPLAEEAVALVLALAKRIVPRHNEFRGGRDTKRAVMFHGKTAGILGMGSIGTEVAKMLKGLGMNVIAIRRDRNEEQRKVLDLQWLGGKDDLDQLMRESDFIIVSIPLTPETRGMIGEHEIRQMKRGSYLVNVARASIVQEKALYDALLDRHLAGAAIDVWWQPHFWDPFWNVKGNPASTYSFWDLDNVICTAHNIASTDFQSDASLEIIVENIVRTRDGRPPINQVNKQLRY